MLYWKPAVNLFLWQYILPDIDLDISRQTKTWFLGHLLPSLCVKEEVVLLYNEYTSHIL